MFTRSPVLCACVGWTMLTFVPIASASGKDADPLPAVPLVVVSGQGVPDGDQLGLPQHIEGAPEVAAPLDDSVPLPEAAVVVPGPVGDVVVRPATGNPFFLGFVAGDHYPKEEERIDPLLGDALARLGTDLRPDPVVYGFVMFSKRMTTARVAKLEELGVRNLGFHPHYTLRAALPAEAIPAIANLDFVRWVGVARDWQKIHPALSNEYAKWSATEKVAVFINVFEDDRNEASISVAAGAPTLIDAENGALPGPAPEDGSRVWTSNGWQQNALEEFGITPKEFIPGVNAFRADITFDTMQQIVRLDFVQFVELEPVDELNHDESVPMIASDYVRANHDGGTSQHAIAGIIDSGVDTGHAMLNHVFGVGWDHSTNLTGVFNDLCGHGSHVAGTIFGLPPSGDAGITGNAPGLGWGGDGRIRIVKYLDFVAATGKCSGSTTAHSTLYAHMHGDYNDGVVTSGPPHVINNSWGSSPNGSAWVGSETNARLLDDEVFGQDQVYVFSAGNDGSLGAGSIGLPAVAKNAITVGSVVDFVDNGTQPGTLADTSSLGPCGDNRWKPNVVAPGRWIRSALAGTSNSYTDKSGTSMAAPHVAGVVSQLVDGQTSFRYKPAKTAAVLMATATQKDETVLSSPSASHLDTYGAGRVNATYAYYTTSDSTYSSWSFTKSASGWSYGDFTVPVGTNRIVVVMHYVEPSASSGASTALRNNFDLYIDRDPVDTANGNTGEYTAQQSSVDNTEIRMIDSPLAGPWRWKVWPTSTSESVKMSVVVRFVSDTPHANGTLSLSASDSFIQPNEEVDVTASFFNPDVVASAVYLDSSATSTPTYVHTESTLLDGIVTDLTTNQTGGQDVLLGDITDSRTRSAAWTLRWATEGVKEFGVTSKSDNTDSETATVTITVDGTDPTQATGLTSSTHAINTWSNDTTITYVWTAATDALSGLSGYAASTTSGSPSLPSAVQNLGTVTSYNGVLSSSATGYYFNLRSVDKSGNWDATAASTGPYKIDAVSPTAATGVTSTDHSVGVWSNDATIAMAWTAATDAHSGLAGYDTILDQTAGTVPAGALDAGPAVTSKVFAASTSPNPWYLHIRSRDVAGNWGPAAHAGPYLIDNGAPSGPTGLGSSTHTAGVWSTQTLVTMNWTSATDGASGLAGYDTVFDQTPGTVPSGALDAGALATSKSIALPNSASAYYFHVRAQDVAGNWGATQHFGPILIDNAAPGGPTNVVSTSHAVGVLSNALSLTVKWTVATDAHSGLAGYATLVDTNAGTVPGGALNVGPAATGAVSTFPVPTTTKQYWFHVRARDNAGNWGAPQHLGPFVIGVCNTAGSNASYGTGKPGTTGVPLLLPQDLPVLGESSTVLISNARPGAFPILILGISAVNVPWDGGTLLAQPNLFLSLPVPIQANGTLALTGVLPPDPSTCGATVYHQVLIPDPGATGFYKVAMTAGLARTFGS